MSRHIIFIVPRQQSTYFVDRLPDLERALSTATVAWESTYRIAFSHGKQGQYNYEMIFLKDNASVAATRGWWGFPRRSVGCHWQNQRTGSLRKHHRQHRPGSLIQFQRSFIPRTIAGPHH